MSRLIWVGVGAAGGIYTYRKATRAAESVRTSSVRRNVGRAVRTVGNLAASARYFAQLTAEQERERALRDAEVLDIRPVEAAPLTPAAPRAAARRFPTRGPGPA